MSSSIHWTRNERLHHHTTPLGSSLLLTSLPLLSSPSHHHQPTDSLDQTPTAASTSRTSHQNDGEGTRAALFVVGGFEPTALSVSTKTKFRNLSLRAKEVRAVDPGRLGCHRPAARPDPATPGAGVVGLRCRRRPLRACWGAPGYGPRADAVKPVLRRGQFRSY